MLSTEARTAAVTKKAGVGPKRAFLVGHGTDEKQERASLKQAPDASVRTERAYVQMDR